MRLATWLKKQDVRLAIKVECELDPTAHRQNWVCRIQGFLSTSGDRPAVFLSDRFGEVGDVEAHAGDPRAALQLALRRLQGMKVNVLYRERDETLTFPARLTI